MAREAAARRLGRRLRRRLRPSRLRPSELQTSWLRSGWPSLVRAWSLRLVLVLGLVVGLGVGGPMAVPQLAKPAHADGPQPVSGAFNLGSGLSGQVDQRTGQFSLTVPLVTVQGIGGSSVSFSLSWVQSRAGAGVNRMGWGDGWSLGSSFVDSAGGNTVYTASGGVYQQASDGTDTFASGLQDYTLEDISFEAFNDSPTLPARPPAVANPVVYEFTLSYDDGKVDYFDPNGNLAVRLDRFGNRTDLQYEQAGADPNGDLYWRPTAIIDTYGLTTSFVYDGTESATISSPKRSDGKVEQTAITFDGEGGIQSVTDPVGRVTSFQTQEVNGQELVYQVTAPSGATTQVAYQTQDFNDGGVDVTLVYAQTLSVLGADGNPLSPVRSFDLNPPSNSNNNNYAGNNGYLSTTEDALFASGDASYQYQTEISTDTTSTLSTYDSAHRLVGRTVSVNNADGDSFVVQDQSKTYPDLVNIGLGELPPANYSKPLSMTVTHRATTGPNGLITEDSGDGRTVTTSTAYDSHGRLQKATDETGVSRTTTFDPTYGLPTSVVVTDTDGTTVLRKLDITLTDDKKSIHTRTQSDIDGSGDKLSARTVTTYAYDEFGQPSSEMTSWAPGAAPADNGGGPASTTTTYTSTVDVAARTQTMAVTKAAGTTAAVTDTVVLDLVSGQAVKHTDALGRVTTNTYDEVRRVLAVTPPTGLTATTAYVNADPGNNVLENRTVTEADGHITVSTYDALARLSTITDNVKNGAFVKDPTTRQLSKVSYDTEGMTVTSVDKLGRTSSTTTDPLGRVVKQVGPTGLTSTITYDDVTNLETERHYGVGAATPSEVTGTAYDDLNRAVASRTTYPVTSRTNLVDPATQTTYDGLSRIKSLTSNDVTVTTDYAGPGGVPVATTIGPAKTARNPATPVLVTDTTQLNADRTKRSLAYTSGDEKSRTGTQISVDAIGNTKTATDGLGRTSSFEYAADGRLNQRTDPDGTVSKQNYDPTTGRLTSVSSTKDGTTVSTTYTYVPSGQVGAGLVETLTNESGTVTYGYDADRNRTSVTYPDGSKVSYDYLDSGLLNTVTDVTGAVTTYAYNGDATMKSATQVRGTTTIASVSYTYDALRRVYQITRGNGLVTTHLYTPNSLLQSQVTVDKNKNTVESHTYGYDNHHNLKKRVDITAKPASCVVLCTAGASTYGTFTTTYSYDAYDRLIGSKVYTGGTATGTPTTQLDYTLDVSGNIGTTTRTTNLTSGTKPTTTVQTTTDTFDDASQLTSRTVGKAAAVQQAHDPQGRVTTSLSGSTTTYRPDGLPATVTVNGATTTYSYWPDGRRSKAVTTGGSTGTTTIDYHYGVDGTLLNDTTTQAGTGSNPGTASASYLLTTGREARTLAPVTTTAGKLVTGKSLGAPVTTGSGVGYYLRDRHTSVTAMVDSGGAVTNTYAYSDWGAPALLDGRVGSVTGAVAGTSAGTANPLQYAGAAAKAMYTDTGLGTMMLPARFYDPNQSRFTVADFRDAHNLYLGFGGNPIMNLDPTGQASVADIVLDCLYAIIFIVGAVLTGGAASAAVTALAAAETVTASVVVPVVVNAAAFISNAIGVVTSGLDAADDGVSVVQHQGKHGFLSAQDRTTVGNIATFVGSFAGIASGVADAFAAVASNTTKAIEEAADVATTVTTDAATNTTEASATSLNTGTGPKVEGGDTGSDLLLTQDGDLGDPPPSTSDSAPTVTDPTKPANDTGAGQTNVGESEQSGKQVSDSDQKADTGKKAGKEAGKKDSSTKEMLGSSPPQEIWPPAGSTFTRIKATP